MKNGERRIVREENWQALVGPALCEHLGISTDCLHAEVQTLEGSIADLVAFASGRVLIFELKMAEPGELTTALGARGVRQLRHYRQVADEVYLVTLTAPRTYQWADGRLLVREPLEAQLLPEGVGWMSFDMLSRHLVTLRPAPTSEPIARARVDFIERVTTRLSRSIRAIQRCRQCPA